MSVTLPTENAAALVRAVLDNPLDDLCRGMLRDELQDFDGWAWPTVVGLVKQHPDNDGPRLLAATWFEEQGDAARAEFVRVQCEIERHPSRRLNPDATYGEYAALLDRETESFGLLGWRRSGGPGEWRRGFLWRVRCGWGTWCKFGDRIVADHPVEAGIDLEDTPRLVSVRSDAQRFRLDGAPYRADYPVTREAERSSIDHEAVAVGRLLEMTWPGVRFRLPERIRPRDFAALYQPAWPTPGAGFRVGDPVSYDREGRAVPFRAGVTPPVIGYVGRVSDDGTADVHPITPPASYGPPIRMQLAIPADRRHADREARRDAEVREAVARDVCGDANPVRMTWVEVPAGETMHRVVACNCGRDAMRFTRMDSPTPDATTFRTVRLAPRDGYRSDGVRYDVSHGHCDGCGHAYVAVRRAG
jgi:uncharacterized protein (TIGR02996 family)